MNYRFHHLGVACQDLFAERSYYETLGYSQETDVVEDDRMNVKVQFMVWRAEARANSNTR